MTTWCYQTDIKSTTNSRGAAAGRHSIAQILGLEAGRMATGSSTSDHVKLDKMMVISDDQPLDLSLDKSKCRAAARLMPDTTTNRPIKRTAGPLEDDSHPLSEEDEHRRDDDEEEEEEEEDWAGHRHPDVLQPDHLQMAANFSTVLQYYLTAARLFQANEAMRSCHTSESHQRVGDDSLSHSEAGNVSPGSDPAPTDSAFHQQPAKRRKKDLMIETAVTPASSTLPAGHNNNNNNAARPRKTRTTFTGKQLFELERIFEQKKYLSSNERQEVARLLSVTGSQIKIWFQNRRTKWKKQDPSTAAELAQLKSASRSQQQQQSAAGPSSAKTSAKAVDSDEDEDGASASSAQAASPHPPV